MADQTSFIPLASGPRQPAYWRPPTGPAPASGGCGQPAGVWTSRPVSPAQNDPLSVPAGTLDTGGRRPQVRVLVALLALMTVVAGVFAVLYVTSSAEEERKATKTTVQGSQACQEASTDLLAALNGTPDAQATRDALGRMATACQ